MNFLTNGVAMLLLALGQSHAASWPDPERLRNSIDAFQAADKAMPVASGAVLAVGSSSIRLWQTGGLFAEHMKPLTVVNRGFGGSVMNDVEYFLPETVLQYRPRAVLIYEGDNDVSEGITTDVIMTSLRAIVRRIHDQDATVRIYLLSVKPSLDRWQLWPKMQAVNQAYRAYAETDARIHYLDLATSMLTAEGLPRPDIFVADGLHMNRAGYALWRRSVADPVIASEQIFEADKSPAP